MSTNGIAIGNRQPATGNRGKVGAAPRAALSALRLRRRGARGQTTTEYLMIAGIMTAIGILILLWMFQPWRKTVGVIADCVRTDDCEPVGAK